MSSRWSAERPQGEKQGDRDALTSARQALVKDRNALLARRSTTATPWFSASSIAAGR